MLTFCVVTVRIDSKVRIKYRAVKVNATEVFDMNGTAFESVLVAHNVIAPVFESRKL